MHLHVKAPLGPSRMLARDLNFKVAPGERLLIVGRSGIGKSSILRALAGLWDEGGGQVVRPPMGESLFLSQKPYMTIGSLRDNCVYPSNGKGISNEDVTRALEAVNMGKAAERVGGLHNKVDFSQIFSLGEQQRLQFARILLNRPRVVILDESTSALDLENEVRVYDLLLQLGVTVVSVGNRPSLVAFHDRILRMMGDGEWQMEEPQWKIDQGR
jgi:putative ATP-binding cassette transporter